MVTESDVQIKAKSHFEIKKFWSTQKISFFLFLLFLLGGGVFFLFRSALPQIFSPEDQLYTYVETAMNIVEMSQKEDLLNLVEGDLKSALAGTDDATFKQAYVDKQYELESFSLVKSKKITNLEIEIDFQIVYKSWSPQENPDQVPVMDVLNRAQLVFHYGRWAISSVESLNATYDWSVGIPVMSVESRDPNAAPIEVRSNRSEEEE